MAKIVDQIPGSASPRATKYPWDEWLDGRTWELTQGVDFDYAKKVRGAAHFAALRRGVAVTVNSRESGKKVYIRADKPQPRAST